MKKLAKENIYPINAELSGGKPKASTASVLIKLLVSVAALILAAVFSSLLFVDYNFEYAASRSPSTAVTDEYSVLEGHLTEDDIPPPPLTPYDFTKAVPESNPVSFTYFNDTVFIGDSRTKGLILLSDIKPSYDFSASGLNIASINTKAYIRMKDEETNALREYTVLEALELESGNYHSIYISTGLNELGWSPEGYIAAFDTLIKNIRSVTDVPIYVQLVLPVTDRASRTTLFGITNEKCVAFNALIRKYVAKNNLFLLDPLSLFSPDGGTMASENTIEDGIHLNRDSCAVLAEYYRTHIVDIYAYSNTRPSEETEQ